MNERLDHVLSSGTEPTVIKVAVNIREREITSRAQLKTTLAELEERIGAQLDQGAQVRIV